MRAVLASFAWRSAMAAKSRGSVETFAQWQASASGSETQRPGQETSPVGEPGSQSSGACTMPSPQNAASAYLGGAAHTQSESTKTCRIRLIAGPQGQDACHETGDRTRRKTRVYGLFEGRANARRNATSHGRARPHDLSDFRSFFSSIR